MKINKQDKAYYSASALGSTCRRFYMLKVYSYIANAIESLVTYQTEDTILFNMDIAAC